MSQTLILAITLFTLLSTVAFFWYQANRNRDDDRPDMPDPTPARLAPSSANAAWRL